MKILLISDKADSLLYDHYRPGVLDGIDLILSCGDLKSSYLTFLVTMGRAPLYYVHGNHDAHYEWKPPEGCDCIEDKLVTYKGLRILGLGGSPLYSGEGFQYSERQMRKRIRRLRFKLWRAGGIDILLTHAPAAGWGDAEDYAHRGFDCFNALLDKYKPKYHVHGHVHTNYGKNIPRTMQRGETTVVNACGKFYLEI